MLRDLGARRPRSTPRLTAIPNGGLWSQLRSQFRGARDGVGASGLRPLNDLLTQVEKSTQVRRSGLDQVLVELQAHRDAATDPALRSALIWLCNAQSRIANNPTPAHSRELLLAAYEVKRVLSTTGG